MTQAKKTNGSYVETEARKYQSDRLVLDFWIACTIAAVYLSRIPANMADPEVHMLLQLFAVVFAFMSGLWLGPWFQVSSTTAIHPPAHFYGGRKFSKYAWLLALTLGGLLAELFGMGYL